MKAISEPGAVAPVNAAQSSRILVWDVPVRVFHWLMVLCFAGAYLSADNDDWRLLHITFGYTMAGLVVFRLFWGLIGTRYARFRSFVRGPKAVARYLGALRRGQPEQYTGHNPAGALAIVLLLALTLTVTSTGWATYNELVGDWLGDVHEVLANLMLAVIGVHVAGVLISSRLHHENLVGAMFTGRKPGQPQDGIRRAWRSVAALILLAVLGFWWLQWHNAPLAGTSADQPAAAAKHVHHHD